METTRQEHSQHSPEAFERVESVDDVNETSRETPPPQTWKHPDDGKTLPEKDEEIPLKP